MYQVFTSSLLCLNESTVEKMSHLHVVGFFLGSVLLKGHVSKSDTRAGKVVPFDSIDVKSAF